MRARACAEHTQRECACARVCVQESLASPAAGETAAAKARACMRCVHGYGRGRGRAGLGSGWDTYLHATWGLVPSARRERREVRWRGARNSDGSGSAAATAPEEINGRPYSLPLFSRPYSCACLGRSLCATAHACVRATAHACVRATAHACVRATAHACVRAANRAMHSSSGARGAHVQRVRRCKPSPSVDCVHACAAPRAPCE